MFGRPERWTGAAFALDEVEDPTSGATPPISFRSLKPALRRRRRLWITTAIVGMLLGASLHVLLPGKYPSVTKLYLVEPAAQAMADDIALLSTQSVADQALGIYRSKGGQATALSKYKGIALSTSIMSINLTGSSPAEAIAQGNAVATAFLQVRAAVLAQQTQILINKIQSQMTPLQTQIQQLTAQIDALPAKPTGSQATQAANLVTQRNGLEGQVGQLQNQISQASIAQASHTQGSRILDPSRYMPPSKKKVAIKDALTGLIAGLALGMLIVVVGDLLSDRLRRRSDVAAALGAPVELSVGHLPDPKWLAGIRLRRELRRPRVALRQVQRRLREHLESTPIAGLTLVEVQASRPAALALTALAIELASEGKRVMLFDTADGRPLATVLGRRAAADPGGTVVIKGRELSLFVAPEDPALMAGIDFPDDADMILTLATVDPALGADHMTTSVSEVVVMVRAGATNAVHIDAVGQLLRVALIGVRSAVLIDADPDDHSSGLPAGYRTADDSSEPSFGALKAVHP